MITQKRWDSPVLKSGMVLILVFLIKELGQFEIENAMIENFVNVAFALVFMFLNMNNPKDRTGF